MSVARVPIVLDLDLTERENFLVLLLLLGHPCVDLRAVTVTPGTVEQVGLVRWALKQFGREIPIGALAIESRAGSIAPWYQEIFGAVPLNGESASGWEVLRSALGPATTMITTSALSNLSALLWKSEHQPGSLGKLVISGGDAWCPGEGDSTRYQRRGLGDDDNLRAVFDLRRSFDEVHLVPHRETNPHFDHASASLALTICGSWCRHDFEVCTCSCHHSEHVRHIMPCCEECPYCGTLVTNTFRRPDPAALGMSLFCRGMDVARRSRPLRSSLAAALAIALCGAEWADVEAMEISDGWLLYPCDDSGVQVLDKVDALNVFNTLFVSKWEVRA